jgi:hypothetical protein
VNTEPDGRLRRRLELIKTLQYEFRLLTQRYNSCNNTNWFLRGSLKSSMAKLIKEIDYLVTHSLGDA